jgi:O-antigen/teichoic acid export membrane protein
MQGRFNWSESRVLLADGMRFLGAGLSNMLIYNWPVYWIARTLPASQSSHFALLIQATILPLGFIGGFLLPLWPLTADAVARGDSAWIAGNIRKGRAVIAAGGVVAFLVCLLLGNWVMRQWLHKPIAVPWQVAALVGLYMPLAIWEYFHFILAMGFGHLRQATTAVFQRSIAFAIAVPLLARFGGIQALWCGLCISVLLWTAWLLPALCHVKLDENSMGL